MMKNYCVTGEERKRMVRIISEAIGESAIYTRMPECAYVIGDFKVSKHGELIWDAADEETIARVTEALADARFTAEESEEADEGTDKSTRDEVADADTHEAGDGQNTEERNAEESATAQEPDSLCFSFPRADFTDAALNNLRNLVAAKATLIRKSLQADRLDIETTDERISFPWWDRVPTPEEITAYSTFLAALVKMAKEAKRVTAKEHPTESEKYSFRVFLLRLGFIGPDYKETRATLLKPLSGYAAFKNKADADAFYAKLKEQRKEQTAVNTDEAKTENDAVNTDAEEAEDDEISE